MTDDNTAPKFDPIKHRRGGRPRKAEPDRHSCVLRIRITPEKYLLLSGRADEAGMSLSAYARATFEDNPVKVRVSPLPPIEVWRELRMMGINLNQALQEARTHGFSEERQAALEEAARTISTELGRLMEPVHNASWADLKPNKSY